MPEPYQFPCLDQKVRVAKLSIKGCMYEEQISALVVLIFYPAYKKNKLTYIKGI